MRGRGLGPGGRGKRLDHLVLTTKPVKINRREITAARGKGFWRVSDPLQNGISAVEEARWEGYHDKTRNLSTVCEKLGESHTRLGPTETCEHEADVLSWGREHNYIV